MDEFISRHIAKIFRVLGYRRGGKADGDHHRKEKFNEGLNRQMMIMWKILDSVL